jgi:ATPase subunit of ABC transporter with duplicated ATPase domains
MESGAARTFLHRFLFTGDQVFAGASSLSKGEQGKLQFACFMASQPDLLILDEPTNHMDIPAIECLQQALQDYSGALIIVSHDREFLMSIGIDTVWHITDGMISCQSPDSILA